MMAKKNHTWTIKEVHQLKVLYPILTRRQIAVEMGLPIANVKAAIKRYGVEKKAIHTPEQRKMLRVMRFVKYLLKGSRSVGDMAKTFQVDQRTIYRYVKLLESLNIDVEQDFDNKFFIPQVCCPLCGHDKPKNKTTNNHYELLKQAV